MSFSSFIRSVFLNFIGINVHHGGCQHVTYGTVLNTCVCQTSLIKITNEKNNRKLMMVLLEDIHILNDTSLIITNGESETNFFL